MKVLGLSLILRLIIIIWIANQANLISSDLHLGLARFNLIQTNHCQLNQGLTDISTLLGMICSDKLDPRHWINTILKVFSVAQAFRVHSLDQKL